MAQLTGSYPNSGPIQLSMNEVYEFLSNMLISTQVFTNNIYDTKSTLVEMSRVDGGLYGDSKRWIATDVLRTYEWAGDAEAENLLQTHRAPQPDVQLISIDTFRMIPLTTDDYLTKRAFADEGTFSQFNGALLKWMRDTKKVYDSTMFNTFVGTTTAETDGQNRNITLAREPEQATETDLEAYNRMTAQTIGYEMANIMVELEDVSRELTDLGNLRSFNSDEFRYVWNSEWVNRITKLDLPTIFHKEGMIDKFAQHTLPGRYFGKVNEAGGTAPSANNTIRSLIEIDYNTAPMNSPNYDPKKHIFPGDLIPAGEAYSENTTYTVDPTIVCKIYHKDSIPFMSAFETGTEFWNPRALNKNHYLIWGYSSLKYIKDLPFITITAKAAE